jgi:glutathione peroxidase
MAQTFRQKLLKIFYPVVMLTGKLFGAKATVKTNSQINPGIPFPFNSIILNNGKKLEEVAYKNKKILVVNTASDCGYTKQYEPLQKLYETYTNELLIIGFPANDFKNQETKNDTDIESFCKVNYGVSFPLSKKAAVIGNHKHEVFEWLSNPQKNGWCNIEPEWNFSKYILNEQGLLLGYFGTGIDPLDSKIISCLETK